MRYIIKILVVDCAGIVLESNTVSVDGAESLDKFLACYISTVEMATPAVRVIFDIALPVLEKTESIHF